VKEEWRDIKGYEGLYQVSNKGRVKSLDRTIVDSRGRIIQHKGRILKPVDSNGYFVVGLYINKKMKQFKVHRLIMQTFIPNPENKPEVNHKDGIKHNNNIKNLEWNTSKENVNHGLKIGLIKRKFGVDHYKTKLKDKDIVEIYDMYKNGRLISDIANKYKMAISSIELILYGTNWKHLNIHDKSNKRIGEKHRSAKLKESDVINIINEYKNNDISLAKLGKKYGIGESSISKIIHRKTWKHLNISTNKVSQ